MLTLQKPADPLTIYLARSFPTSLARSDTHLTPGPGGMWATMTCISCPTTGRRTLVENLMYSFFICDECSQKYGGLAMPEVPPDLVSHIFKEG